MATAEEILLLLRVENAQLKSKLTESETALNKFQNKIKDVQKNSSFADIFKAGVALVGLDKLAGAVKSLFTNAVQGAMALEQQTTAFEVMLGSAEKAKELVTDMRNLAAETPLLTTDIMQASQTYIQYGGVLENVIPTMKMLGDVSLGNAEKFQQMNYAYSQIMAAGRLQGQDLRQLVDAGFNPLQVISEKTGKSMLELKKIMESGGISFKTVETAFKAATSEGGKFFNMMERQSETLGGKWSTLKDKTSIALTEMGTRMKGAIGIIIDAMSIGTDSSGIFARTLIKIGEGFNTMISGVAIAYNWFVEIISKLQKNFTKIGVDYYKNQIKEIENTIKDTKNRSEEYIKSMDVKGKEFSELWLKRGEGILTEEEKLFAERYRLQQLIKDGSVNYAKFSDEELSAIEAQTKAYESLYGVIDKKSKKEKEDLEKNKSKIDSLSFDLTGGGEDKTKELKTSLSEYYAFTEQKREEELVKLLEQKDNVLKIYGITEYQKLEITKAYNKKQQEINDKYNNQVINEVKNTAISAADNFDQAFTGLIKQSLNDSLNGKNGFKEFKDNVGKIFADLLIDMTLMVAKAAAFRAILGLTTGGTSEVAMGGATLGGILKGLIFENGRLPVYEQGKMPVLQSGYVPSDHFAAYIGTREAVIDADTTRANYGLLKAMMSNPGQPVNNNSSIVYNIPITGNVMSDEFVEKTVFRKLESMARRQGAKVFYTGGAR